MYSTATTAGGLPTPTHQQWQPPLPTQSPPPMPTSASMPTTSTPTSTTIPNVAGSNSNFSDPTARLINFNDPYSTPEINRVSGQPAPWSTPSYPQVQPVFPSTPTGSQWYGGGSQSASPYQPMTALTVSPEDYIFSGISISQDPMSQAPTSVRMLNGDNLG